MAREVQLGRYIYTGSANKENENEVTHVPKSVGGGTDSESLKHVAETTSTSDLQKCTKLMREKKEQIENNLPQFQYNTLHDVKSCYWILLWFFFHNIPKDSGYRNTNQNCYVYLIFPQERVELSKERDEAIDSSTQILRLFGTMHPTFRKASKLVTDLAQCITLVQKDFKKELAKGNVNPPMNDDIYEIFINFLNEIVELDGYKLLEVDFINEKNIRGIVVDEKEHMPEK